MLPVRAFRIWSVNACWFWNRLHESTIQVCSSCMATLWHTCSVHKLEATGALSHPHLANRPVRRANLLRPSTTPRDGMYATWQRPWNGSRLATDVEANSMSRTCTRTCQD